MLDAAVFISFHAGKTNVGVYIGIGFGIGVPILIVISLTVCGVLLCVFCKRRPTYSKGKR